MNHQILIIQPILPRAPIALISLGLGSFLRDVGIREEFSYTPLALFLNRARMHAAELTRNTQYVSRDGDNIIVAPRFEFIIQLASSLKSLSDHHQVLMRQDRDKKNEFLVNFGSLVVGNYLEPFKFNDHQMQSKVDRISLVPFKVAKYYPSSDGSILKNTISYLSLPFLVTQPSYIRSSSNLDIPKGERASKGLAQIGLISHDIDLTNDFVQINSPIQSNLKRIYENLFYLFKVARNGLSLITRGNHNLDKLINAVLEIQHSNETLGIPQEANSLTRASSHHYHGKSGMLPISVFHHRNQFLFRNSEIYKVVRHLITTFSQRNVRRLNEINSSESLPFVGSFVTNTAAASYEKQIGRTQNHGVHFSSQQTVRQRESGAFQERLISPPQLSYRTERKQSLASVASIAQPAPPPVNTPKIDIDRLSRDVWNQIEKRIRIERERHGRL